ncbi:hypothetical protein ACFY1B_44865 [Streptomyces mirabilis]|uniref:hypothetical protein n=1 Tax=Streptomyces mirabilis TaxID=68239 RepID=UPI0036855365
MTHDGATAHIDLGQALRGHRFAHRARTAGDATVGDARTADLWAVLRAPGLVWTEVDATGQDEFVVLGLLGRLHPDNVFLRPAGHRAGPTSTGRNGPSRLAIDLPDHDVTDRPHSPPKTR